MNLVQIDLSNVQALQAGLSGLQHFVVLQMASGDLGRKKNLVADVLDRFPNDLFGTIGLGGIDQRSTESNSLAERLNSTAVTPDAYADFRDVNAGITKVLLFHSDYPRSGGTTH